MPDLSFDTSILTNTADLDPVSLDLPGLAPGAEPCAKLKMICSAACLLTSRSVGSPARWSGSRSSKDTFCLRYCRMAIPSSPLERSSFISRAVPLPGAALISRSRKVLH